jgi:fibronectin type 3 domain-containing protein
MSALAFGQNVSEYKPAAAPVLLLHLDESTGTTIAAGRFENGRNFGGAADSIASHKLISSNDETLDTLSREFRFKLIASSVDSSQISLSWQNGGGSNAYYRVYRSLDSISFVFDTTISLVFTEHSLLPSTKYYFKVSAVNSLGLEGGATAIVSQYTHPTTPRSVVATPNDTSTVTIVWASGGDAATLYRIYRGLDSMTVALISTTASLSYVNPGLLPSQKYFYRVSAVDSVGGEGTKSYAASAVTPPSAPRNLIATALDTSRIRLTWTANGSQDRYYKIRRGVDSIAFTFIDTTSLLNYVNSDLSPSTKYFYRVSVVNTLDSEGILSPTVFSITLPVQPRNLSAVAVDSNSIDLTWIAGGQAIYYKICSSLDTVFNFLDTASTPIYHARNLLPSSRYFFEVSAVNASAVESQKTSPAFTVTNPARARNLNASSVDTSRIMLTWVSGGGTNAGYRIFRSPDDSGYVFIDSSATLRYTAVSLSPSVRYYFRVSALNSVGIEGPRSVSVTDVTFPSTPRNVSAYGTNQTAIRLTWQNGGGAVTRYRVYSGPDSLSLSFIDSTAATTYDHTGLTPSVVRAYRVSAVNFAGYEGTRSNLAATSPVLFGEYLTDANTALLMHFNESSGAVVNDVSGNGNNGIARGTTIVNGRLGNARKLRGNLEEVVVANSASLNPQTALTLEAWINLRSKVPLGSNSGIVGKDDGTSNRQYLLSVTGEPGPNRFRAHVGVGSTYRNFDGSTLVDTARWYHVALTYDNRALRLYVNGVLDGSMTVAGNILQSQSPLHIGSIGGSLFFLGVIDEIRVSNIVRSSKEFDIQLPPVNLFATDSLLSARLQWENGGGAVGLLRYRIYRGFDSTNVAIIDSTKSTLYLNVGLAKGTRYFYRISAIDSTGFEGAKSYAATIRTSASQIAAALDSIPGLRTGTVGLSFHLPAVVEETLVVKGWYAFQGDTTFRRATLQRSATRLVNCDNVDAWFSRVDMAGRDATIQFYLTIDAPDTSARSNTITVHVDNQAPIFAGLDSALADSAQVTLRWRAGSDAHGPLTYLVHRGTTPGIGSVLVDSVASSTGRTITGLSNFTRYYFRVFAQDAVGNRDSNKVELSALPSTVPTLAFVQVDTPRVGIVSRDVTIRFRVLGDVLDTVQLNVFYSLDDGRTWTKTGAMKENISQRLPNPSPDSVHWISCRDLPSSESDSMLVQIIPVGRGRTSAATMSTRFKLDNIAPSFGGVQAVDDDTSGNMLKVRWSPARDTHKPIRYFVYVDSGSSTNLFNSLPTQAPTDTGIVLRGLSNFMKYFVAVRSEDAAGNRDSNKVVFSGVPSKPLRIDSIIAPQGRWRDSVCVKYYITAAPEDTIHMLAEYSVDAGATWKPAKGVHMHGRTAGDTIITSARYKDTLWWNTKIDSSKMESLNMKLRLTPGGRAAIGLNIMSNLFEVDTKEPQFPGRFFVFKNNKDSVFGRMLFGWAPATDLSEPVTYMVFKSETSGVYNKSTIFATTTSDSVTLSGLQSNTLYYLKLWAIDSLGNIDSTYADTSRMTSLLCDYNDDGRVDSRDLPAFVSGWRTKNANIADIGPVIGTIPKASPAQDGKIDIEDLTVFIRMWDWAFDHNKGAINFAQSLPKSYADSVVQAGEVHFPDESIIQPGETKSVALSIRGFKDFSVTTLTMNYDPAAVRIDSVTLGKVFGQLSAKPLVLERLDEKRGLTHIAVAAFDDLQLDAKSVQQCLQVYVSPLKRVRDEKIRGEYELYASDGTLVQFGYLVMTISDRPKIPLTFAMSQNYPNPFNPSTTIDYQLPVVCNVTLKIFNIIGQEVATLINQEMNAGYYDVRWNTSAATGVYFYVMNASSLVDDKQKFSSVKKMMILH